MASVMVCEAQGVWLDRWRYEEAESRYFSAQFGCGTKPSQSSQSSSLVSEIAKARQHIQQSLTDVSSGTGDDTLASRLKSLELENSDMRKVTDDLQAVVKKLEQRIAALECTGASSGNKPVAVSAEKPVEDEDDDDDIDLFGSDDEVDEEAERIKEERLKAYAAKKSKKPTLIAKSNVILDVKPWDDETDMGEVERLVRTIEMPGLLWGTGLLFCFENLYLSVKKKPSFFLTAKLVPVGYGIKKLTISCVVEDDKVSIDDLEELITGFEDFVQSVDIAAFNKI